MRKISKEELLAILQKHEMWLQNDPNGKRANLSRADLSRADLSRADLSDANLSRADLSLADIDYSSLPLWCGSLDAQFDDRQIKQIAYHLVKAGLNSKNTSEETKRQLRKIVDLANGFHRASECGKIIITNEEVS